VAKRHAIEFGKPEVRCALDEIRQRIALYRGFLETGLCLEKSEFYAGKISAAEDDLARLDIEERIRRYRLMAEQAVTAALAEQTAMRQRYIDLARQWTDRADEMQDKIHTGA
jgi:hypothetical protein